MERMIKLLLICIASLFPTRAAVSIVQEKPIYQWSIGEFRLANIPAATNPFDTDQITVRCTFRTPSGKIFTNRS